MPTDRTITALVIPPGDDPAYLTTVRPDLATLQALVDGNIEPLGLTSEVVMYLNEDGKYTGLPINGNANKVTYLADPGLMDSDFIVGQVVLVGVLSPAGDLDGDDHDVPASALDLCLRAGVPVEDRTG